MLGLCTLLWIGSAMLLGGEGLCCKVAVEVLGGGGGVLAAEGCWHWKGVWGWSGLSKPCSSNNCKFARKTSMLARRKKDKTGWRMDEYGGYTNAESKNIINGGIISQGEKKVSG